MRVSVDVDVWMSLQAICILVGHVCGVMGAGVFNFG